MRRLKDVIHEITADLPSFVSSSIEGGHMRLTYLNASFKVQVQVSSKRCFHTPSEVSLEFRVISLELVGYARITASIHDLKDVETFVYKIHDLEDRYGGGQTYSV